MKKYTKVVSGCLAVMLCLMPLAGCSRKKTLTPEEEEALRLEQILAEEKETGVKRLTSPNLTEYEKVLVAHIEGIKTRDEEVTCATLGVPENSFGDYGINEWMIANDYEIIDGFDLENTVLSSVKSGNDVTIKLAWGDKKDDNATIDMIRSDGEWFVKPKSGVVYDYTFISPTSKITCNGRSYEKYAEYTINNGTEWFFSIPRMLVIADEDIDWQLETTLGKFKGVLYKSNDKEADGRLVAKFPEAAKKSYEEIAAALCETGFLALQSVDAENTIQRVVSSGGIVSSALSMKEKYSNKYMDIIRAIRKIEFSEGNPTDNYPADYVYRLYGTDGIIMNTKYRVIFSDDYDKAIELESKKPESAESSTPAFVSEESSYNAEIRKYALLAMRNINGSWKIVNMVVDEEDNIFTALNSYDPQW